MQPDISPKREYNLTSNGVQDNGNNYAHTPLAVIRLAELYLNLAECHAALNNKQDVLDNLNIVRNRAGIPDLELSDINSDMSLMDWVRSERYAELWFEGHRYFDARRWTIAPEVFKAGVREGLNAIAKKIHRSVSLTKE